MSSATRLFLSLILLALPATATEGGSRFALRFLGTGSGGLDRAKIPLTPDAAWNVGGDFTMEFWMRASLADNAGQVYPGLNGDGWITGNVIIDRDVYGAGDFGDYGIALGRQGTNLVVAFGVNNGISGQTIVGTRQVGDGLWHHVAVTRRADGTGRMRILVDGTEDAAGDGPTGNIAYRIGRPSSFPDSDPFLVFGAEKHDAGEEYPSFAGDLDEVRLWSRVLSDEELQTRRDRILEPAPDEGLVGYWRFEEGSGTVLHDSAGTDARGTLIPLTGGGEWRSRTAGQETAPLPAHQPLLTAVPAPGGVAFTFFAVSNVTHWVQHCPQLNLNPDWQDVSPGYEAAQSPLTITLPASNGFWRVQTRPAR